MNEEQKLALKKDLAKLHNKHIAHPQASKILMDAISAVDGHPISIPKPALQQEKEPEKVVETPQQPGVYVLTDKILIVPTPTEDIPKGFIVECNGKKAEGNIKAGVSEYELPPIITPNEPARAYLRPKYTPMVIGEAEAGIGKSMAKSVNEVAPINHAPDPSYPGV